MSKHKILFTIPNFTTAGSGREMFNIIERLDKSIFEPIICINKDGGDLLKEIQNKGYKVIIKSHTFQLPTHLLLFLKSVLYFRKLNIDIWQSFNWSSDFSEALLARLSGSKFVYLKKNMNNDRKAWKIKYMLSDAIIARNSTMLTSFLKPFIKKAILISGGVNPELFCPNNSIKPKNSVITIVSIAQLVRVKGQDLLIRAIEHIPNVRLILVGAFRDEAYKMELLTLINTLNLNEKVTIAGSVSNVKELLDSADIFVLPTSKYGGHEEGSPVALLEAMSMEKLCIASNVAGSRDLLINGITGFLFEPDDLESLRNSLELAILNITNHSIKQEARNKIVLEHTLEIEVNSGSKVYEGLIHG